MGHVWGAREMQKGFGGETEGKRPVGRPDCRWMILI